MTESPSAFYHEPFSGVTPGHSSLVPLQSTMPQVCTGDGFTWLLHCGHVRLGAVSNHLMRLRKKRKTHSKSLKSWSTASRGHPPAPQETSGCDSSSHTKAEPQTFSPVLWLTGAPSSTRMLHPHLQDNSWLNLACELIFNRAELLQSLDLSGRQALNSRSFAGASGSAHGVAQELLYQDVTAEIPAWSAPRGATEHGSAERGAPGWALL